MSVRVVTDSSCDLPADLAARHAIEIVPLSIRFGDEELVDRQDLTTQEFWAKCASSSVLPETAAPSPGAFEQAFRRAAGEGADGIVCINLSSKLSATIQAADAAAKAVAGDIAVQVLDSRSITMGLGNIVLGAARAAAGGAELAETVRVAEDLAGRTRIYGTLDTLDNLKKGGRIGGAQAFVGSLLSVKPTIDVKDGAVESGPRLRTRSRAFAWVVERVAAQPVENLAVMNGNASDIDRLLDLLSPHVPRDDIVVADLGPVIGAHAGPGTVGVAFQVQ
jgi:DegV family protein with EDD domain